jgi:sporulation protein YlmC with PRC-barrel domain
MFSHAREGQTRRGMGGALSELLALPVRHRGVELGRVADVLVDLEQRRVLGLEVHCGDDVRRFLPLGAARLSARSIEVGSELTLVDDLGFYRKRGSSLRSLRAADVEGIRVGSTRKASAA